MDAIFEGSEKKHRGKKTGYVFSIIFNLLFLYIANNLISWQAQFITPKWSDVLGIINVAGILNVIFYATFLFYDKRFFYYYSRTLLDIFAIIVTVRLYFVFPFDFNGFFKLGWLNEVFPYILILGVVGVVIGTIVRTVRLIQNRNIHY